MVDFKLNLDSHLPFDYIRRFTKVIFEGELGKGVIDTVSRCAQAIGNDSFLTEVNLHYSTQTVALACVMLSAYRFKHTLPTFCLNQGNGGPMPTSYPSQAD